MSRANQAAVATYRQSHLFTQRGRLSRLTLALELERSLHLRAICFNLSILKLNVLLHDLCDPKVTQSLAALSTAAFAAFSHDSVPVPTSSMTL
jgi:hypothetical protein